MPKFLCVCSYIIEQYHVVIRAFDVHIHMEKSSDIDISQQLKGIALAA
jgi:hypothetical protein